MRLMSQLKFAKGVATEERRLRGGDVAAEEQLGVTTRLHCFVGGHVLPVKGT